MSTRHIVYMRLDEIRPAQVNAKTHDLPSLVESLVRYGWTETPLLDERTGRLVAGHGRREAAIKMHADGEDPPGGVKVDADGEWLVPVERGWASRNDIEARAYVIASNRLTEAGGWHHKTLAEEVEDIVTLDAGLMDTLGYTADDIDDMIRRIDPETMRSHSDGGETVSGGQFGYGDTNGTPTAAADAEPGPGGGPRPATRHHCPSCGHQWWGECA